MSKLRLVILGMMGRCPFGGQTWLYLNWLRAFSSLGHEVYYVEDESTWPYDPIANLVTDDCRYAVNHLSTCMARIGLPDRWVFRLSDRDNACWGLENRQLQELYQTCDVLLNIVGGIDLREEHMHAAKRVYVETDPVTAELRLAAGDQKTRDAFASHNEFFTYGENYGAPDCKVPLNGMTFQKIRQPIDLDLWPMVFDEHARDFTTIGNYRQEGSDVEYNGETYRWSKHYEWEKVIDLPRRTKQRFELAMMPTDEADCEYLRSHGWRLTSPFEMSLDIFGKYPAFFQKSRGEFTVAKDQNVRLRSGWFSERAVCYLASGKPVVTQDTGFGCALPTGEGLFSFNDLESVLVAIEAINSSYSRHCHAARAIAGEYFSAPKIGAALLREIGA